MIRNSTVPVHVLLGIHCAQCSVPDKAINTGVRIGRSGATSVCVGEPCFADNWSRKCYRLQLLASQTCKQSSARHSYSTSLQNTKDVRTVSLVVRHRSSRRASAPKLRPSIAHRTIGSDDDRRMWHDEPFEYDPIERTGTV